MIVYNSFCCHDNGLSPSGKALDSDSSISGVRIPQAQLVPSHLLRGFFNIIKKTDFGVYLGTEDDKVLLPKKQVPEDIEIGDALTVFVYRDSSDRLIATTNTPKIELGGLARLKVSEVSSIGAFLDWGLEKNLLLPYREQTTHVNTGDEYLVALYIDRSNRLAATMKVSRYLQTTDKYVKDSAVSGTVIGIKPEHGIYVAIDDKYYGFITRNEMSDDIKIGDVVHGRVIKVREDNKITISIHQKAYIQMDEDSTLIYNKIVELGGSLGFTDKADPEVIKKYFNMSKNAFKRAVGRLLKQEKVVITENSIVLK